MRNGMSGKRHGGPFTFFLHCLFSITAILHLPPSAGKESLAEVVEPTSRWVSYRR